MENKLDLILLEELTRRYGKTENDSFPGEKRNFSTNSYFLDINEGRNRIEVRMHEYPAGNSRVINLDLYAKSGPFGDYKRILSYTRGFDDEKNLTLLTGNKYKENRNYSKDDSTFIEMKYTKNVKTAINILKNFAYNKEAFEKLAQ
ncbi:MAG: hypothetical protein OH338_02940 [Candidatus Parvarchaeota archaeon]|nr:hypothetical protein [Candidatus Parvarchaeota archaeon]MCW1294660.1 hypothetical protein [Candidatus Parvarchaeum tengchongense]MCW1295301.1 hypothetical protein [Candidatus Parvarchaeum tengchongense]MCW1298882.1 hypothetical protein [Candidatus Parvarchaeum tengchongense]MCW1312360.1 hypothetical protein [Candidatus Parvarchaeum tengchongense]